MTEFDHKKVEQPTPDNKGASEGLSSMVGEAWNWMKEHKTEAGTAAVAAGLLLATKGRSAAASRGLLNDAGKLEVSELEMNTAYRQIPMTEVKSVKPTNIRRSTLSLLDEEAEQPPLEPIHYFTQLGADSRNVSMKEALADIRLKTGFQNPKESVLAHGKPLSIINDSGIVPKKAPVNWALADRMLSSSKAALDGAAAAAKTAH